MSHFLGQGVQSCLLLGVGLWAGGKAWGMTSPDLVSRDFIDPQAKTFCQGLSALENPVSFSLECA